MSDNNSSRRKKQALRSSSTENNLSPSWEYKITPVEFIERTSAEEREHLRAALNKAITFHLSDKKPVFLENLGILFPIKKSEERSELENDICHVFQTESLGVIFEKCLELDEIHLEQHEHIVQTPELTKTLFSELSSEMKEMFPLKVIRRLVRGLIQTIKNEIVVDGFSRQLGEIGDFFALHNRQGDSIFDWFAGADIFLAPTFSIETDSTLKSTFTPPLLRSSSELFEAAFGKPIATTTLELANFIEKLGYSKEAFQKETPESEQIITVSVFRYEQRNSARLHYVTDGLRHLAQSNDSKDNTSLLGTELTVQIPLPSTLSSMETHELPFTILTLGWILLKSNVKNTLSPKCLMSADNGRFADSNFSGVLTTPCQFTNMPQKTSGRLFKYINIVGITENEFNFGYNRSSEHLLALLKCKNYDQVSNPKRRSITQ